MEIEHSQSQPVPGASPYRVDESTLGNYDRLMTLISDRGGQMPLNDLSTASVVRMTMTKPELRKALDHAVIVGGIGLKI